MTREEFEIYVDHFNNRRYDDVLSYFADDVRVQYFAPFVIGEPEGKVLNGREAFRESYEHLHSTITETMELRHFLCDGKNLYAELWTEFHANEDTEDFSAGVLKKGEDFVATNFVLYWLDEDGKYKDIRIAHHEVHDPSEAFLLK
jgi:hypothetical protein